MKIGLVCSHGGHLTEMMCLMEAFEGHEIFFVTYDSPRTKSLLYRKYLMENIGTNIFRMIHSFFIFVDIYLKERPDIIITTGSEIAIPAIILAKLAGIKTIYIESWCRVSTPSGTGKVVYPFADEFLVQWPELLNKYGKKAKFQGAVV